MASLTGNLVAETYKALLKTIDNDILTASEKQITDGFGGGSNVFIDSNGFLRANKYKVTNGLASQFLKADGSLDANTYLTSINSSQIIAALGFTPVTNARTLTINGTTYDLSANRSWTIAGTSAVWGNITGTLSNQTDLQTALNAKFNNPNGTISQYIRGDGSLATFPTLPGGLPTGGTTGQILAKINATDYNTEWIDNFATQTKNEVKLGQTLTKGTAVYVSSANGTNMIVSAASNTTEALSSKTFGLLETGGSTNAFVKCVTFGLLAGLDTSTATAGDPVWLGVNGALIFGLANKPYAPAHLVYIGVVTRVQSNNGEIFVNVQNGFELKEIHDVYIADPANNHGLFYDLATGLWKNKSIVSALGYTPQAQLSGTGFVKASGTTISYDNSTYLTTTDAASTYQRLDKMVSNLLASATEYPNSNAVIAALALKADALNPVFTGNMTISGAEPKLTFTDTDQNPDYFIGVDAGFFRIYDQTAGLTRFVINSSGVTTIAGDLIVGTIAKTGGTASQFLKADGTIDSSTYVTSATLANYLLSATAATTYQTLANLSTDLTASATKYPSVNAVVTGLGTKQPLDADLTAIAALVGTTGFLIKTAADTWSLDTNTYLTTTSAASTYLTQTTAASTYQRLDKMVSNLLASSTEYPNSNAVLAKLALKADAANPVFTGNMTISGAEPKLYFTDTDNNPDYTLFVDSGYFYIYDQTAGATKFQITPSGNAINSGTLTSASFIKSGGTSSQFLKADGSIDSSTYLTSSSSIAWANITGKPTSLSGYGITDAVNAIYNINTPMTTTGDWIAMSTTSGISGWTHVLNMAWSGISQDNWVSQLAFAVQAGTGAYYRTNSGGIASVGWTRLLDDSNYGSYALPLSGGTMTGTISSTVVGTALKVQSDGTSAIWRGLIGTYNATADIGAFMGNYAGRSGIFGHTNSMGAWNTLRLNSLGIYGMGKVILSNNTVVNADGSDTEFALIHAGNVSTYAVVNRSWTNWGVGNLVIDNVVGLLAWKNYGNNHVIFDASSSTSPSGTAVNNTNAQIAWTSQYPTLMGWNGSNTYGVRVDSARIADSASSVAWGNVTSKPDAIFYYQGFTLDANTMDTNASGFTYSVNAPYTGPIMRVGPSTYSLQINAGYGGGGQIAYRTRNGDTGLFNSWFNFITSANIGSQTVASSGTVTHLADRVDSANYPVVWAAGSPSHMYSCNAVTIQSSSGTLSATNLRASAIGDFGSFSGNNQGIGIYHSSSYYGRIRFYNDGTNNSTIHAFGTSWVGGASAGYINIDGAVGVNFGDWTNPNIDIQKNGVTQFFRLTYAHSSGNTASSAGTGFQSYTPSGSGTGAIMSFHRAGVYAVNFGLDSDNVMRIGGWSAAANRWQLDMSGNQTVAGSSTATSFFESSDMRLKTLIDGSAQIAGIEHLEAKLYEKDGKIEFGYFAQDAQELMPYAVTTNMDGFLNLSYREVHTAKIARLEQRVAELEKQLNLN
jgi:hypothetical protein